MDEQKILNYFEKHYPITVSNRVISVSRVSDGTHWVSYTDAQGNNLRGGLLFVVKESGDVLIKDILLGTEDVVGNVEEDTFQL